MNILLQTGDKIKFKFRNTKNEALSEVFEGYIQIARGGNGVHYTADGEYKIAALDDIGVVAVKRKGIGEWI